MLPSFQADALCPRRVFRLGRPRNVVPVAVSTRSRGIVVLSAPGVSHADERPGAAVLRLASAGRCCFDTGTVRATAYAPLGCARAKENRTSRKAGSPTLVTQTLLRHTLLGQTLLAQASLTRRSFSLGSAHERTGGWPERTGGSAHDASRLAFCRLWSRTGRRISTASHHRARFCPGNVNATRTAKRLATPATLTDIS